MPNLLPELNPKGWDEIFSDDGVRHSYRQVLHTLENLNLQSYKTNRNKPLIFS